MLDELDRRSLAGLKPHDCAHSLIGGERSHRSRIVEVAAKGPLTVHGLTGSKRGGDQLSMVRDLDGYNDHVDVGLRHQLLVV